MKKCTKVYFADEKNAQMYIDKLQKTSCREIKPIRAYLCERCFNWHLTSIEYIDKIIIYKERQINNLKAKIIHLENENEILKLKLDKLKN